MTGDWKKHRRVANTLRVERTKAPGGEPDFAPSSETPDFAPSFRLREATSGKPGGYVGQAAL